jgi:hypothetical protein
MIKRPSYSEIQGKIRQAKEEVLGHNLSILKPIVVALDALELGYSFGEINALLINLLDEIKPGRYAGQFPPQRSYEDAIFQSELFAFQWRSRRLGCEVYLKFAFKDKHLWLISLHPERIDPKGRSYA